VGECSGGMHGSNRLGGNSLSDLLVFGRRSGTAAADYVRGLGEKRPQLTEQDVLAAEELALAPFGAALDGPAENPFTVHSELQQAMNDLVGIIRREGEIVEALGRLDEFDGRVARVRVSGGRAFNPGWHLALDLRNMLLISRCIAMAALERTESRGGHTREDHPKMDPQWRQVNLVLGLETIPTGKVTLTRQPVPTMRNELLSLFDRAELAKYYTSEELSVLDEEGSK
jgi:succinate dehydrogenase / fumarate reductase flavoprotein subunit